MSLCCITGKADEDHLSVGVAANGVPEVGPEPVVLSESEAKGNSSTEASGPPSKMNERSSQDEPSRSSDTSETSSQSEERSRRPSSEDTKKVCVCVCVCVLVGGSQLIPHCFHLSTVVQ